MIYCFPQLLSQLTTRIRLYGGDCNQTALVVCFFLSSSRALILTNCFQLEAIKQTGIDMQVYAGNFVVDGDPTAYERQRDAIKDALITYGADHVAGITVGNEFMLKSALMTLNPINTNSSIQLPYCSQFQGPQQRYSEPRLSVIVVYFTMPLLNLLLQALRS